MKDKLLPKSKFPLILGLSALFIALCAAFFSVYGIATLFAGASISAMVMASSLEVGKLVGTTFLYRYWHKCQTFLKSYLIVSILVLMAVTSLGIFGYLSAAYQKSSIQFGVVQDKITSVEGQKTYHKSKMEAARKRIDDLTKLRSTQEDRMSGVITNEFLSRNPLQLKQLQQQTIDLITETDKNIKDENAKIQESIEDVRKIDEQVNQLKLGTAEKKDVVTFKFVADALKLPLDTVARWFILSIIFVFDPLAICLILAYNVAVYRKEDESVYDKTIDIQSKEIPNIEPVIHVVPTVTVQSDPIPTDITTTTDTTTTIKTEPVVEEPKGPGDSIVAESKKTEEPKPSGAMDEWFKRMFKIS